MAYSECAPVSLCVRSGGRDLRRSTPLSESSRVHRAGESWSLLRSKEGAVVVEKNADTDFAA